MILDRFGNNITAKATATKKGKVNPSAIIAKIAETFKDRSRKDIDKWRSAIKMAELPDNPRRDMLYSLIDDLKTDGHLQNQKRLLKSVVLNTEFQIIDKQTGDIDVDKTDFFRSKWFYSVLDILSETTLYGHSLIEFQEFNDRKIKSKLVPRGNVVPNKKSVILDFQKADEYTPYNTPEHEPWILEYGEDLELGILNDIVPNLIWKRNMMQSWAEFCEKFGIPLVTATSQLTDDKTLDLIDDLLDQLGEAAHAVFPQGTEIDIKESNRTDVYQVFDAKIKRNNEEVSKAITGSTMLTDDGSSRSQSEVHERNLEERIAPVNRRSIAFFVNDDLIPLLQLQGYSFTDNDRFVFDTTQTLSIDKHWEITKGILETHEVDETWIAKTFNVPILGKKKTDPDSSKAAKPNASLNPINAPGTNPLTGLIGLSVSGVSFPIYDGTPCCEAHDLFMPMANYDSDMHSLHEELFENYWNKKSTLTQEARITAMEGLRLLSGLREGWGERAISVAYNEPDLLALSLMEFNLFEFSASKTEARLASMHELIINKEKLNINSFNDFKREAFKITNTLNTNYLRTEYNTSVAVGQNGAAFYRAMAEQDTIPYVQYLTAGDNAVRSTHQMLDKRIFNIKDKEAQRIWPPNEHGCRCNMVQYPHTPDKGSVSDGKKVINEVLGGDNFRNGAFGINRGDTKQVFTNKQYYHNIKGLPDKINKINCRDTYGLADYSSFKKGLKGLKIDETITADNLSELFKIDGKKGSTPFMGFSDYLKRKITLKKSVFDNHTTGKYISKKEIRHQMFPHVQSVLNNPDEVWLHEYQKNKFQSRYIKFYNNMAFVIDTELSNTGLEIKSWYQLKGKDIKTRKGLLIK